MKCNWSIFSFKIKSNYRLFSLLRITLKKMGILEDIAIFWTKNDPSGFQGLKITKLLSLLELNDVTGFSPDYSGKDF